MDPKLFHLFFGQSPISLEAPDGATEDSKVDFWKVAFRTGEWKLRPGPGGVKLKEPLKIFRDEAPKGHLSMSEIQSAFEAPAKEHVTMPTVHADGTVSDSGFVRQLVIEDVKDDKGNVLESKLWAGCNVTDSQIKLKVEEKSLVGVSAGVLFNYERTEDGKKFPQVMTHLMITNSPWINGCGGFEKELPEGVMAAEVTALADEEQEEVSLDSSIPMIDGGEVETGSAQKEKPGEGTVVWRPEEGFSFMKGKVQRALDNWRRAVMANIPSEKRHYDDFPYMRVDDVSHDGARGKAMIGSGYGDDAVAWVAQFKLDEEKDAVVEPFQNWVEAAQEWVAASEEQGRPQAKPAPSSGRAPYRPGNGSVELSDLRRAQLARDQRSGSAPQTAPTNNGGRPVSKLQELPNSGLTLSDDQKALFDAALAEERDAEAQRARDSEVARESKAKSFLSEMDGWGLGDNITPGLRAEVRNILMSDDGGTALMLSEVTESGQRTTGVKQTATEIVERVLKALPRNAEGKVALSEQARRLPADTKPPEGAKENEDEKEETTAAQRADALLSEDGFNFAAPAIGGGN